MRTLTFKNNDNMPALGLGTWLAETGKVYNAVKTAIKEGYRHIDCALVYGNEKEVGRALKECISEGIVSRSEMWITSKLWCNSHAKEDVLPALKQTLKDLQISYVDLYLVHWPVALKKNSMFPQSATDLVSLDKIPLTETWTGMESAKNEGLAKHIGVSNFGRKNLENLISNSSIKPEMNQVECHPYFQQEDLFAFCKENEIHLTAYSPLGSFGRPVIFKGKDEPILLEDPTIVSLANSNDVTPAQVLISWALHRGMSVIPKSVNPKRISENLKAEQLILSEQDMNTIANLDRNYRYVTGQFWVIEGGPYTLDDVWA